MDDILQIGPDAPDVSDRECGNGVVIQHNDGFETQYCHMAQGSITVSTGQTCCGHTLGKVGLSGQTQFPHLHVAVRKDGKVLTLRIRRPEQPALIQPPVALVEPHADTGGRHCQHRLADGIPEFDAVKAGTANVTGQADGPAMVAWAHLFGTRRWRHAFRYDDGPKRRGFRQNTNLERDQARAFRASGKRTPTRVAEGSLHLTVSQHPRGDSS